MVCRISFTELCSATDNFSEDNLIGIGKTGKMYKATLHSGSFLAVKKLHDSEEFESQFAAELLALARLKHDDIVPLLGFCIERNEKLLVYKYMSNGSLHDWLHPGRGKAKILEWPMRVKIAIGVARRLSWLHHHCNFRVVHLNISSKCVLLDDRFEPKISNFSKTIISNHEGAMVKYANENDSGLVVNSEEWETDFLKEDVFKYGIVLIELVLGSYNSRSACNNLVEWIDHVLITPGILDDVIDKSLSGQGFDGEIKEVLRIAYECVQAFPDQRPTMLQLYRRISGVGERYGIIQCNSGHCSISN